MKKTAFIQARMESRCLENGIFSDIAGEPMLAHVLRRTKLSRSLDQVVVVTSIKSADQPIVDYCNENGWLCFRGAETDLLDRFYQAASHFNSDIVARIYADCPLIDPFWIDAVIDRVSLSSGRIDYVSNFYGDRKLPRGLEAEAITLPALRKLWANFQQPKHRERPLLGLYENSHLFKISTVHQCEDLTQHKWNVENEDDLSLVREIYSSFPNSNFSWVEVLAKFDSHSKQMAGTEILQKNVA